MPNGSKPCTNRDPGCKKSVEEIGQALTGTWRAERLFVRQQALEFYDFYTQQPVAPLSPRKRQAHSQNAPPNPEDLRQHLKRLRGVDLSLVDGFGVSLAQTVMMECGTDMAKFPTEKHFCSWLGLAPKHEISGAKVLKNQTLKTKNRAGQAFRLAAHSLQRAEGVNGVMYRRLRARLGPAQATVAIAHALAGVVYCMLKDKVEYAPLSVGEYEKQYEAQQLKYLQKKAAKLGYQLVPG